MLDAPTERILSYILSSSILVTLETQHERKFISSKRRKKNFLAHEHLFRRFKFA